MSSYPEMYDKKTEAILSRVSTWIRPSLLISRMIELVVPVQNTYGHEHNQNTHANMSGPLYGHTHIYKYIYTYLQSTHNRIQMYISACAHIHTYIYAH